MLSLCLEWYLIQGVLYNIIPKIIHQSFYTKSLPIVLKDNIDKIQRLNPLWKYILYDDDDQIEFIKEYYGDDILSYYLKINPLYGAARADLFRYLLIYEMGGVWLDMKGSIDRSLDSVLHSDDEIILSQWKNGVDKKCEGFGLHKELKHIDGGEFQQWCIISCKKNPFIHAVILKVLDNITKYSPKVFGVGRLGVLRTTGPIAYTLSIFPLLDLYSHRMVNVGDAFGFKYSIYNKFAGHYELYNNHYSSLRCPVIVE